VEFAFSAVEVCSPPGEQIAASVEMKQLPLIKQLRSGTLAVRLTFMAFAR
jgi:hypothetical protein